MFEEMLKQSISGKEWGSSYVDEVMRDNFLHAKVEGDESTGNFKVTFFVYKEGSNDIAEQCTMSIKDNIIE